MTAHRYKIGDRVVLNEAPVRFVSQKGPCRIVALLPASLNGPQYRVRFEGENFERCIAESDVDNEKSFRAVPAGVEGDARDGGAWVTPLATTVRR
ncbi:hypothetical protein [Sinorhizobium alkalisoli]|uniref:Uncharacterized protein n=1 Tax=Sinorhizobium alkalisoli TaxID=1752398 RepID=A0A1E3V880_9HYPH|nr:hypothetical protein [Sinorhizobium alkalisoli]MCA1489643.1 cold-shock protein [Ensifer sp. NBAIM29]MCG5478335.1 cold-shock protein [Sinorhizobium alkalisoli]ODR89036.1 hypothetical protein A8M32_21470 [Sinorhizobium alkalisoli]QFI65439.1 hypothetical protein EKH55_0565 [Sinorhizobium alkalisoli]